MNHRETSKQAENALLNRKDKQEKNEGALQKVECALD